MNQLLVAFGGHQVAIHSDAADVLASLAHTFKHLRSDDERRPPVSRLSFRRVESGFECVGPGGETHAADSAESVVRWARYQAIERLIAARGDLIWFHGAAAGLRGRAIVLPGRRGHGKSTLVTGLWARGCSFLSDDILPLDPRTDQVLPFPQLPAVRLDPGRDLTDDALGAVPKNEIAVVDRVENLALRLTAFVLPAFKRGCATQVVPCSIGEAALALLEGCWNLARHGEAAAAYVARLSSEVPVCRIAFSDPEPAADRVMEWVTGVVGA